MTKKETAEMDALRDQLAEAQNQTRVALALRFTEKVLPDVPKPQDGMTKGYLFNTYGAGSVALACSDSASHSFGGQDRTTTQGPRALYSTRLMALRGLRHEVEKECSQRLALIDRRIEQELA